MDVTLYAIAKNEEKNVEKFIKNSKYFSKTVVVDTGSSDNTVQLLRDAGIKVHEEHFTDEEFDFSIARNIALSLVDTEWAFSLDFNEEIETFESLSNFETLEMVSEDVTVLQHERYDVKDDNTEPTLGASAHPRFHRTENYTWKRSVHEQPSFIPTKKHPRENILETSFRIIKKAERTESKEKFYLSIAEREFNRCKDNEGDPEVIYYLYYMAVHNDYLKNYKDALDYGLDYLSKSSYISYFDAGRVDMFLLCSTITLREFNNANMAANYVFHALSEAINLRSSSDNSKIDCKALVEKTLVALMGIGKVLQNSSIIVFASSLLNDQSYSREKTTAIDDLFFNNISDLPPSKWSNNEVIIRYLTNVLMKSPTTVTFGVDWGYPMFLFARERTGHVYGIQSFTTEDSVRYEFLNAKREKMHLKSFMTFVDSSPEKSIETWDTDIDILDLGANTDYEDLKKNYETWSKFVNSDGVILFYGSCVEKVYKDIDDEIVEMENGIKKLFEEIDLPKCNFVSKDGNGLGIVSHSKEIIEKIKEEFGLN